MKYVTRSKVKFVKLLRGVTLLFTQNQKNKKMDLDNLFEQRNSNRNHKAYNYTKYNNINYSDRYEERKSSASYYSSYVFSRIRNNRNLRTLAILVSIVILSLIVFIIIALFPLLVKAFNFIAQNGVNGIIESGKGLLEKILNGTGKLKDKRFKRRNIRGFIRFSF